MRGDDDTVDDGGDKELNVVDDDERGRQSRA